MARKDHLVSASADKFHPELSSLRRVEQRASCGGIKLSLGVQIEAALY